MSPALITQAPPAHVQQQLEHSSGQISHPFSFDFSGFSRENQSNEQNTGTLSPLNNMNFSSNAADKAPGFNDNNTSNIRFESVNPFVTRSGPSGLSRPRFVKARRGLNSQNPRPPAIPETQFGFGYNPFRSVSESTAVSTAPSSSESDVSGEFDKSGNEGFVFGENRNNPKFEYLSSWGTSLDSTVRVSEDLKNLKIGSGGVSSGSAMGSDRGGFTFGSGYKDAHGIDESIVAKLPEDIKKLSIKGGSANEERIEKAKVGSINLSGNDNVRPGSESTHNVGGSMGKSAESELQNDLKKLNIKETGEFGRFGGSTKVDDSFRLLSDEIKNLKINEPDANLKNMPTAYFGDKLFQNIDKPADGHFTFQAGLHGNNESGNQQAPSDHVKDGVKVSEVVASSSVGMHFQTVGNIFEVPAKDRPEKRDEFIFAGKQAGVETPHIEFKTSNPKKSLFSGLNDKVEFGAKSQVRDTRMKKKSGKQARPTKVQLWLGQDFVARGSSSQENHEASDSYSPMDVSPYQETLADNRCSRENSVTSDESFSVDNYPATDSTPTVSFDAVDEDLTMQTAQLNINETSETYREIKDEGFECPFESNVEAEGPLEESASGAETESFKSATEEVDFVETEATSSNPNIETHDSDGRTLYGFATSSEDMNGPNFTFSASSAAQGQLPSSNRLHKKKHWLKVGQDGSNTIPNAKVPYASSSVQFIPFSGASSLLSTGRSQQGDSSSLLPKGVDGPKVDHGQAKKQESVSASAATVAVQEACEKWRLRGNQAYTAGDLSKAEDCYTQGVNYISRSETSKSCLRALMLCYSNRAAARMSLGRIRDALGDCMMAAEIDPNFLRVQVRAANCYLALGGVEDASRHFKKCLQSGSDVCVDRKVAVESSDGLQKAQKVSECMNLCAELLQRKTSADLEHVLDLVADALIISPCSEKLLEMKAEALFMMQRYEEAIELCEQTVDSAQKNSLPIDAHDLSTNLDGSKISKYFYFRLWRCRVIFKSYFFLEKLEEGLASLEKQDEMLSAYGNGSKILESSLPLAVTVREVLCHKAAGNEAYQAGRHAEAVECYTAALSCNVESRPFAAVCFCNRAAAYKALGHNTDAIADCSLAIALDGKYLKAISRRATLYEMIRDYGRAANDLQRLVSLLTKQVEEKINHVGASEKSQHFSNDLRQARMRLFEIEEEARKDIPLDMYLILGVEPSVSASEIKKAYRKAALRHHPDKAGQFLARSDNGDDSLWKEIAEEVHKDADRLFKMIGEAYTILSDPTKRARYDAEEEMRNAQKKRNGSSTPRAHTDVQNYPFERSSGRRNWREVWRAHGTASSRGPESTWSSRYQ